MKQTLSFLALGSLVLTAACTGTDGVGIQVRASTVVSAPSEADLVFVDDGSTAYDLDSAYLRLRDIELDLPDGQVCSDVSDVLVNAVCDDGDSDDKIRIPGPFDVDLVAGVATPSLADVVIPEGTYKRIDFRVDDNADDVSFAVAASFVHDGDPLTLDLSLDFNEDIRIEEVDGTTISVDTDLIAEFVVDSWLAGVDVGACIENGDVQIDGDVVVVSDSSTSGACSDIEDTIKQNMKNSGRFDHD